MTEFYHPWEIHLFARSCEPILFLRNFRQRFSFPILRISGHSKEKTAGASSRCSIMISQIISHLTSAAPGLSSHKEQSRPPGNVVRLSSNPNSVILVFSPRGWGLSQTCCAWSAGPGGMIRISMISFNLAVWSEQLETSHSIQNVVLFYQPSFC